MTVPSPTPEQAAILEAAATGQRNIMVRARAGTGKTSTLEMVEGVLRRKPFLYLAFNTRIVKEAEQRLTRGTTVRTFNSLGHRLWAQATARSLTVVKGKCGDILRALINEAPRSEQDVLWNVYWDVLQAVERAKSLGYIPEGHFTSANHLCSRSELSRALDEEPDDLMLALIDEVLVQSIKQAYAGKIDFNDQIYMTALFAPRSTFPRFPTVGVDEYQDLNPVNHVFVQRLLGGTDAHLIGVGDDKQNIYGFRGAKAHGMDSAILTYEMQVFPLTLSFRCPEAIVASARWHVPEFRASREGGRVDQPTQLDPTAIPTGATILCRNNAPLLSFALQLLGVGKSVSVTGTDIGPRLIKIMQRLGPESLTQAQALGVIADWLADKLERNSASAQEMADCMRVFVRKAGTLSGAIAYAQHLFAQQGSITLLTIHKAKGLEWPLVYLLEPALCDMRRDQDRNLLYVAQTRSSDVRVDFAADVVAWPEAEAAE